MKGVYADNPFLTKGVENKPLDCFHIEGQQNLSAFQTGEETASSNSVSLFLALGYTLLVILKLFVSIYAANKQSITYQGKAEKIITENDGEMVVRNSVFRRLTTWLRAVADKDTLVPSGDDITKWIDKEEDDFSWRASQRQALSSLAIELASATNNKKFYPGASIFGHLLNMSADFKKLSLPAAVDLSNWMEKEGNKLLQLKKSMRSRLQPLMTEMQASNDVIKKTLSVMREVRKIFARFK